MVRMQIQPRHFLPRGQDDAQLQLCVPQVTLKGASYRLRNRGIDSLPSIKTQNQAD
jgi:hypothetical protein